MNILAIDTSNDVLGIALLTEDQVVGEYITNLKRNQSIRVMPAIEKLMADCGMEPKDLDKIVVAKGPGSYTGIRVGVTIAKTMAWTLGIPLSAVSSLAILSGVGRYFDGYICPVFDARRGLIYTGLYTYRDGTMESVVEDTNILATKWIEQLQSHHESILFVGNDLSIHKDTFVSALGNRAYFAEITEHNPRPSELGRLGIDMPSEDIHSFTPNYIRLVEAEVKWLENQEKKQC